MHNPRPITFLLPPRALALDAAGPAEVFSAANRLSGGREPLYRLRYVSLEGGLADTSSGLRVATEPVDALFAEPPDTLIVVGGMGMRKAAQDASLVECVRRAAALARRVCSVCTGAFLLAAAGLLDGRRAVTHWGAVEDLRRDYPEVRVELDPVYVEDGPLWTSAGVSAGIDLALALVAEDHGRRLSLAVARELVVFLHRPGGQAQFSRALEAQTLTGENGSDERVQSLQAWMAEHIDEALTVERLAEQARMAPRTFARTFQRLYGRTPAKALEDLRLEAACRLLEEGVAPVKSIAAQCGFHDEERMRRVFMRRFGVPPSTYRLRFAS